MSLSSWVSNMYRVNSFPYIYTYICTNSQGLSYEKLDFITKNNNLTLYFLLIIEQDLYLLLTSSFYYSLKHRMANNYPTRSSEVLTVFFHFAYSCKKVLPNVDKNQHQHFSLSHHTIIA